MSDKILIVDDEEPNREILTSLVRALGYETETAINGVEAITKMKFFTPDLVLLDIMMPDMDGYEVCDHLKSDPRPRTYLLLSSPRFRTGARSLRVCRSAQTIFLQSRLTSPNLPSGSGTS